MIVNSIRLSICITTLNRVDFIGATLDSIISQATDEVEVVIVDGGSVDNTEKVVRQYQQRFSRLRYFRPQANMGIDRDFDKTVELAQGEYCWLMSDDDILKPGAIQTVLDETRRNYGLIIVNAEVRNPDLSRIVDERRLQSSVNQVYGSADRERFFVEVADYLSFIGCVVIKRHLWISREREKYFGTAFIHVGVIFQGPLLQDTLVIAEPLISIRYGNALWTAKSFQIWMFSWPQLIWSFPDYPDAAKRAVCPREPWRKTTTLLVYRARGAFSLKEYYGWLEPRLRSQWSRLIVKTIAQLPGCVLNLLGIIYFSVFSRRSRMPLLDLQSSQFYWLNYVGGTYAGHK